MEGRLPDVLKHVAEYLSLKQWTYTRGQLSDNIENYFGILIPITVVESNDTKQVEIPVFVKFAYRSDAEPLQIVMTQHYETEIFVYNFLIPTYKTLTNMNLSEFFPECYYTSLEEKKQVLVLSDMRSKGYQRYEKSKYFDADHTIISLKALAKFHALSIIYKEQGNDFNKEIMKPYSANHPELYYSYIKASLKKHTPLFAGTIYEEYFNSLEKDLAANISHASSDARYLIYGHGDFWKENLLFKYENEKPVQACLLDFQKSRIMSPAQDLIQFLVINVDIESLRQNHENLLQIYLDELQLFLQHNGLTDLYTLNDLKYDIKIVASYSLSIIFMSFSLFFGLEDDDIVPSKNVCKGNSKDSAKTLYKNSVINVLEYMNGLNYIKLL